MDSTQFRPPQVVDWDEAVWNTRTAAKPRDTLVPVGDALVSLVLELWAQKQHWIENRPMVMALDIGPTDEQKMMLAQATALCEGLIEHGDIILSAMRALRTIGAAVENPAKPEQGASLEELTAAIDWLDSWLAEVPEHEESDG